ncbi:Cdc26 [Kluyveromyces lactis]|nr:Cdc26 [Kluyveromyces lactis]
MLRRDPTVLSLTSDDISELQEHLEEYKLQREIQTQHQDLLKSSVKMSRLAEIEGIPNPSATRNDSLLHSLHKMTPPQRYKQSASSDPRFIEQNNTQSTQDPPNPFYTYNHNDI